MSEANQDNNTRTARSNLPFRLLDPTGVILSPAGLARDAFSALELALEGLKGQIARGEHNEPMLDGLNWLVTMAGDAVSATLAAERGERDAGLFEEMVSIATACAALPDSPLRG